MLLADLTLRMPIKLRAPLRGRGMSRHRSVVRGVRMKETVTDRLPGIDLDSEDTLKRNFTSEAP